MAYSDAVLADTPRGYWRFEESSGTTAADSSGNGFTGTVTGGDQSAPGIVGSGISFPGGYVGANVDIGAGDVLGTGWAALSVEAWFKTSTAAGSAVVDSYSGGSANERNYTIILRSDGALHWRVGYNAWYENAVISPAKTYADGAWHHVVGTWDGAVPRLYVDGSLVATGPSYPGTLNQSPVSRLRIGQGAGLSFDGTVDEVAIYITALSLARVAAHHTAGTTSEPPTSIANRTRTMSGTASVALQVSASLTRTRTTTLTFAVGGVSAAATLRRTRSLTTSLADVSPAGTAARGRRLSAAPLVVPAVVAPPAQLEALWQDVTVSVPDPVAVRNGRPDPDVFTVTGVTRTPYGRPQVVLDGKDVTYARGIPVQIEQWSRSMPFGDESLVLTFPQYTGIETRPGWMMPGSSARVFLVRPDGTRSPVPLWEGYVASVAAESGRRADGITVDCAGLLRYAAQATRQPPFSAQSQDIGQAVKSALDGVVSRPYSPMPLTLTGVPTVNRGARSDTITGYVTDLLAMSVGADGYGWTVLQHPGGSPYMHRLSDGGPEDITLTVGQPGLDMDMRADPLMSPNVIYGVATDPLSGCKFTNLVWSGEASANPPRYPFDNPSYTISVGGRDTDAETDTGNGITVLERRLQETGYIGTVNGVYSSSDSDAVRRFQQSAGIQVDGVVGPQTWSALWAYTRVSDLTAVYYRPMAIDSRVDPYLYAADGSIAGGNPAYDPSRLRVERFVNFGLASRDDALRAAAAMLAQGALPDVMGRITVSTDPPQMNRREIRAGQKVRLRGWGGAAAGVIATVTQVEIGSDGAASLLVDTRARDLVAATAIAERDRSNSSPAWRTSSTSRRSSHDADTSIAYDCSSAQGIVENLQAFKNLWSVIRIPLVDRGTVAAVRFAAGTSLRSTEWERLDPVPGGKKFALGLFAKPITAAALKSVVGNPLTTGSDKWTAGYAALVESYGVLAAWGTGDDGAGFSPGQESSGDTVTGRLLDLGAWQFQGDPAHVPYIWVAAYSESSCFLAGRVYLQAEG